MAGRVMIGGGAMLTIAAGGAVMCVGIVLVICGLARVMR